MSSTPAAAASGINHDSAELLERAAAKQAPWRFTGEPQTDYGALGESAPTPGPWTATPAGVVNRSLPGANVICEAPIKYLESSKNWEANSRLIAAAPDLFDVLREFSDALPSDDFMRSRGEEPGPLLVKMRAVLARVAGESA